MRKGEENSIHQPRVGVFKSHSCMSKLSKWFQRSWIRRLFRWALPLKHWVTGEGELMGLEQQSRHFTSLRYINQSKDEMYRTWLTSPPKIWRCKWHKTLATTDVSAVPWLPWKCQEWKANLCTLKEPPPKVQTQMMTNFLLWRES